MVTYNLSLKIVDEYKVKILIENRSNTRRESRRAKRRFIRKMIPVAVALFLIFVIVIISFAFGFVKKFIYSKDKADLYAYFGLTSEDQAAIIVDNQILEEEKALCRDGKYYISKSLALEYCSDNFYYDDNEKLLLYTTGTETKTSGEGENDFIIKDETVYLSLDYLKTIGNLEVNIYDDPAHIEIKSDWNEIKVADIKKTTPVRILGGVKSEILTEAEDGDKVQILEEMDSWTKVKTKDGFIGYLENKHLRNIRQEQETAVDDVKKEENPHILRDHKICLGWHQVMNQVANDTLSDVINRASKGMNVISPTWFSLSDNNGDFTNIGSSDYVAQAHNAGLEVWVLVDNFADEVSTYEVLSYTSKRQVLTGNLVNAALALNADGINIDFENLTPECGQSFAQFIRELAVACHKNNLVLSVDNYVPKEYTSFYNRKVQGEFADYVIIMGYDEHFANSDTSGSVASFNFVQEGIEKTLEDVPANQVINAIPFYTRVWEEGSTLSSKALGIADAQSYVASNGIKLEWDDMSAQYYGEKIDGGVTYKIWMEEAKSIKTKLDLMESNNIAGVACWKLGFETADIWDEISEYLRN